MLDSDYLIRVQASKAWGANRVLNAIDLDVRTGEVAALVGPSGCGKSTLQKVMGGFVRPTEGRVLVAGRQMRKPDTRIGLVTQQYSVFPHRTVIDNILAPTRLRKWPGQKTTTEEIDQAEALMVEAGIQDQRDMFPKALSGGQRQRVAIMRALMAQPQVLLMDEPFSALDPKTKAGLQSFILEMQARHNFTIVIVTHDLEEALFLSTRILGLSQHYQCPIEGTDHRNGAVIVYDNYGFHEVGEIPDHSVIASAEFAERKAQLFQDTYVEERRQSIDDFVHLHRDARYYKAAA